ncbi:MAG: plasmid pRiA4b ORF-3 family protein [Chloroflexi bacterium]|nr:plasmid pRiA4b ORF-3 family protein [Chloroflexota bacterium]
MEKSTLQKQKVSFSQLTEDVVRKAAGPIPFDEIMRRVHALHPITTRSPKSTIRNAISSHRMIAPTGDGRYGWYPRLITGSFVRVPLSVKHLRHKPPRVEFDDDARELMWPAFFDYSSRNDNHDPVQVELPDGTHTTLSLDHFEGSQWGTLGAKPFWQWLRALKPRDGDALIVEAVDAEAHRYRLAFERQRERDQAAYDARNEAVYDVALKYMYNRRAHGSVTWDLARYLLASGQYKHPVPPQPVAEIYDAAGREVYYRELSDAGIYQLLINLQGANPPIWRRVLVPGDWSLGALHYVVQVAMGWTNSHLHMFKVGRKLIALYDIDDLTTTFSGDVTLGDVFAKRTRHITYEYDFGDSWMHDIDLEAIVPPDRGKVYPRCIGGERACPPDDCGGIGGYEDLLVAIADPDHPEHDELTMWLSGMRGDDFDPNVFDVDDVNRRLARIHPYVLDDGRNVHLFV